MRITVLIDNNANEGLEAEWGLSLLIEHGLIEQIRDRFVRNSGLTQIGRNAWTLGHSTPNLADVGEAQKMLVKRDGSLAPDDFSHEQSLILAEGTDIAIISSCSHA